MWLVIGAERGMSEIKSAPTRPLLELLALAGPTVAQMASYTLLQFMDTWMLADYGRRLGLGVTEPTAAGNSGIFSFALISFGVGVLFLVNAMASQAFGRGDDRACGRVMWQGVWFGLIFGVLMLPALPLAGPLFRSFGHNPDLARLEAVYLQITLALACFKLAATAVEQFFLAVNRPLVVLAATLVAVAVNALANWALIYGHFGLPRLGLAGAAWGTNLAVFFQLAVLAAFAARPAFVKKFGLNDWRPRLSAMLELLKIGVPSGGQIVADVLAWSLFSVVVMAQFGEVGMAANTFMFRYMVVSFMPAFGIATAVTALVGRYIGMGRPDVAEKRANLGFVVCAAYMMTCGLVFYLGRHALIGVFTDDPAVLKLGSMLLIFAAFYQFFDGIYIIYSGALRGAGDTLVPAVATGVLCWGLVLGGGYLTATLRPAWGPAGPWTVATGYGVILGTFMYLRFRAGAWKGKTLEGDEIGALEPETAAAAVGAEVAAGVTRTLT